MKDRYHIIPTFHHDIAYLLPETWYYSRATEILDKAFVLLEKYDKYSFTVEQAYFFFRWLNAHPEQIEKARKYVSEGRLSLAPGFWTVPDMGIPDGESIYMQATLGKRTLRDTVGFDPRTAFIADCWGHHGQLPQILSQCGYDYYVFSRCMLPEFDRENFIWKGIDGTELKSHWLSCGYGGVGMPDGGDDQSIRSTCAAVAGFAARTSTRCGSSPKIIPSGGDAAMPGTSASSVIESLNTDKDTEADLSSMEKALDDICFSDTPVFCGEFIGSLKGTLATNIDLKLSNRDAERKLYSLEVLSVLRGCPVNLRPEWETTLKNQFHDIICGSICNEAIIQARKEYKELSASLESVRQKLSFNTHSFFNPNSFPVNEVIDSEQGPVLCSAEGFENASVTVLTETDISMPCDFENSFYRAEFDSLGYIRCLVEKSGGQIISDNPGIPFGSLQMQVDNGDVWVEFEYPWEKDATAYAVNDPDPYDRNSLPTHPHMMISRGNIYSVRAVKLGDSGLRIIQSGSMNYWKTVLPFETTVTFLVDSPRIDYHTEIKNTSKRIRVRAAFPTTFTGKRIRHQIPYGIVERGEGPQAAQMFIDYESEHSGLSLINRGLPQNNVEQGIMLLTLFRSVAMEYKCDSDLSYGEGMMYSFDYAVCPHPAEVSDDLLWREAMSFNRPVIDGGENVSAGFYVDGAFVSALRYTGTGEDVFLRVFTGTDRSKTVSVRVPEEYKEYSFSDGCMEPGTFVPIQNELRFELKPFEIRGIVFRK